MQNWLTLARQCIRADFPAFESVSLFEAFALSYVPAESYLTDLARMLSLDAGLLQAEYEHMRPVAQWLHEEKGMSATDAWVAACQKNQGASRYPTLCAALARNVAWSGSTSEIERMFGKSHCATSPSRGDVGENRIDDELQLISLEGSSRGRRKALPKHQSLIREAQTLWVDYFGAARERGPKQEPAPGRKRRAVNEDSETAWLKRRREAVGHGAASSLSSTTADPGPAQAVGVNLWTQDHAKEMKFLTTKEAGKYMQAIGEGAVDWDSLDEEVKKMYYVYMEHQATLTKQSLRPTDRSYMKRPHLNLHGTSVWLSRSFI